MAYEQIFGRENIGGTGASFSNTDLTNPGKKKPVKVKEESVTPVQTITKNSPEFFKPSYAQSYKAGHVMPTVSQDIDGNHFDPIPYEALDEVVISNKPQNPVVAGPKTQGQATDYGADTSYKYNIDYSKSLGHTMRPIKPNSMRILGNGGYYGYDKYIPNARNQHLKPEFQSYPSFLNNFQSQEIDVSQGQSQVDFQSLVQNDTSQRFLDVYNDPITRNKIMEQSGLSSMDIDNMIISGLTATQTNTPHIDKLRKTSSSMNIGGTYDSTKHHIEIAGDAGDAPTEVHERAHASGFDLTQGKYLKNLIGSVWQQGHGENEYEINPITYYPKGAEYLNQNSEMYGNLVTLREKLGLNPGEKIKDVKTLKERMDKIPGKKNNTHKSTFNLFINDENTLKALNTMGSVNKNKQIPFSQRFKRNRDSALS